MPQKIDNDDVDGSITSSKIGIHTTDELKQYFVRTFINLLKEERLIIKSERTKAQMEAYIRDKKGKMRAGYGNDDCVMGNLLAVEGYSSMQIPINNIMPENINEKERDYAESITDFITH